MWFDKIYSSALEAFFKFTPPGTTRAVFQHLITGGAVNSFGRFEKKVDYHSLLISVESLISPKHKRPPCLSGYP